MIKVGDNYLCDESDIQRIAELGAIKALELYEAKEDPYLPVFDYIMEVRGCSYTCARNMLHASPIEVRKGRGGIIEARKSLIDKLINK